MKYKIRPSFVAIGLTIFLLLALRSNPREHNWMSLFVGIITRVDQPQISDVKVDIPESNPEHIMNMYGKLPLRFEANQGQTEAQVKFLCRGREYTLFLTSTEAVLALNKSVSVTLNETFVSQKVEKLQEAQVTERIVLRTKFLGANPSPSVTGLDELPGKSNYFIGNSPKEWHTNIPNFARVKYNDVYPGVDLIYYGNQRYLEYDFIVTPGSDPETIRLGFDGVEKTEIADNGDVVLQTASGEIRYHKPMLYQEVGGFKKSVPGHFVLKGKDQVGIQVADYNTSEALIIDPVLSYSTYLGGTGLDMGNNIAVDNAGNAYVIGQTNSIDFPMVGPIQPTFSGSFDVFVTKLNATGTALIYSTYLGGSGNDAGDDIAVDPAGNTYITGWTLSSNFPTASPFQPAFGGSRDAFMTKLNATGSALMYSTYLGGSASDQGAGIAVNAAGEAHLTGVTSSTDFPTASPFQSAFAGFGDVFVTKLNATGSALIYSTYLGGSSTEQGNDIVVDALGNAYVTGTTQSTNFPTTGPFQAVSGGVGDAFVTKLNATGSAPLIFSTYLGGGGSDSGDGIAVDPAGNIYVTGRTGSTNFPTASPFQANHGGGFNDCFVTKLNAVGSTLIFSTYLGGDGQEGGNSIAVNTAGEAYVTGGTRSTNFPTANPLQPTLANEDDDLFVTRLNASGSALIFSTYLGGDGQDVGRSITVEPAGDAYVTGQTISTEFPTVNAFQANVSGSFDAFVTKFGFVIEAVIDIKPGSDPNSINPKSNGVIPVAIVTTGNFDATTVDPLSVAFGPNGATEFHGKGHIQDADGDGDLDLVLHFKTQDTGIQCGDTQASLTGQTFGGQAITGTDAIQTVGCTPKGAAEEDVTIPDGYALFQNHPNPFNPETEIRFQLPEASPVVVKIFNSLGEEIRTLANAQYEPGYHSVRWNGKDNNGNAVSSGIYFYQLRTANFSQFKQMSLLR